MKDELRVGQSITIADGRRKKRYIVRETTEDGAYAERIPTKAEVVKALGYDPGRLAEVMRILWRCE